ncbi:hypothetical protein ACFPDQ_03355 [Pseudofrancisella aestuarii]|uniref:Uncharacterized protein n=2 Tax=Pseudofrancisella aestuarii TaxID=2670347 RepID=A0ABV9TAD2_9GAMM
MKVKNTLYVSLLRELFTKAFLTSILIIMFMILSDFFLLISIFLPFKILLLIDKHSVPEIVTIYFKIYNYKVFVAYLILFMLVLYILHFFLQKIISAFLQKIILRLNIKEQSKKSLKNKKKLIISIMMSVSEFAFSCICFVCLALLSKLLASVVILYILITLFVYCKIYYIYMNDNDQIRSILANVKNIGTIICFLCEIFYLLLTDSYSSFLTLIVCLILVRQIFQRITKTSLEIIKVYEK